MMVCGGLNEAETVKDPGTLTVEPFKHFIIMTTPSYSANMKRRVTICYKTMPTDRIANEPKIISEFVTWTYTPTAKGIRASGH